MARRSTDGAEPTGTDQGDTTTPELDGTASGDEGLDLALFFDGALAGEVTTQDCTLSGGTETTCYSITVAGYPASHDIGPFCPETITDTADSGGLWFDGNASYDLDGQFFVDLPTIYGDDAWQMYDDASIASPTCNRRTCCSILRPWTCENPSMVDALVDSAAVRR